MKSIRPIPLFIPLITLLSVVIISMIMPEVFQQKVSIVNAWIMNQFAWLLSLSSVLFVGSCIIVFFSPIGKTKIGGADAVPLLSKRSWFSITLCTTIAVGLLFWSTAEPIFHLYDPPKSLNIAAGSDDARKFALSTLFLHWSFTPYAIYTIPSLTFALAYYNYGKKNSIGGMLAPLFGKRTEGITGQIIDAIALFALVAGMSSGMGQGLLTLAGGLQKTMGITTTPFILALIAFTIITTVAISAITGLTKGIRLLSNTNVYFFIILTLFVIIFGPTLYSLSMGVDALGDYLGNFFEKSLFTGETNQDSWPRRWTNFYWAQWLAWAPITALFLGRISRGYTVRQFIMTTMIFPSLTTITWMTLYGGMSLYLDKVTEGALKTSLDNNGAESVVYLVLNQLPASTIITFFFILIAFISYVTAADSNTEAIASVCSNDTNNGDANGNMDSRNIGNLLIKIMYSSMIGILAWFMVSFSGVQGIKILANLGALPGLVIVSSAMCTLWYMIWSDNQTIGKPLDR